MNQVRCFRLAIIGLGEVTNYYWPALANREDLTVVGVVDCDRQKVDTWNNHYPHCPAFTSLNPLYEQVNPDAVIIATSSSSHYTVAQEALSWGKPILLEKPATASRGEWEALIEQASQAQVPLAIAFHAAFGAEVLWFLEHQSALEETYGPITGFFAHFYDPYWVDGILQPHAHSLISSWMDSGVNALSLIAKIVRNLELTQSYFTPDLTDSNGKIHSQVGFRFATAEGNCAGRGWIETHWGLGIKSKTTDLQFAKTGYELRLDHDRQRLLLTDPHGESSILADLTTEQPRMVNHYQGVFQDFRNHLQQGTDNLEFAQTVHHLLYSAYESPYNIQLKQKT
ncbi:Gfo/Idh/MocA family oxidoreductase [Roseofilum sp. BLCC_M154]|uniref:Gfo/Idh/MocA family oxidoreductase n=1 Tax=Roseofilum acuticapitatum BLCC-M154 TaxID=3022444 RepID=A0ABT7ARK3_9CYAN|nr:Gfo/Idh/MocA family oxidoreductase [Roseofilum acuticapitatum]MDJ1169533.1 Gfo/Idh/MocA family oxidoreductase [Roseofilum acuticapitatum BLCC-M154]